jgi:hypothetical protein
VTSIGVIVDLWFNGSIIILLSNFGFGTCVVVREKGLFNLYDCYYLCIPLSALLVEPLGLSLWVFFPPTVTH